jgi:hypothetical protein
MATRTPKPWTHQRWGVVLSTRHEMASIIDAQWHEDTSERPSYDGEPCRPLTFVSRSTARAWCAKKNAQWRALTERHYCRFWVVRPVRVVETVRVVRAK